MIENQPLNPVEYTPGQKKPFWKRGFKLYLFILILLAVFTLGIFIGKSHGRVKIVSSVVNQAYGEVTNKENSIPEYLSKDVEFEIFWDVWNIIQNKYIDKPAGETKLFYGALSGLVSSLGDPFSTFMEPKNAEEFNAELAGKFEGIGAEIAIRNDVLTIVTPLAESPAERAGLMAKDIILEIDGYNTKNIDINDAVNRIRGDKGTKVVLKIYREKSKEVLEIPITRDTIKVASVKQEDFTAADYEILGDKKISLIKITNFNADTASRFKQAVQDVLLKNPDGLILDLRGNPGGYLNTAIDVADLWVAKDDVIVIEKFAGGDTKTHTSPNEPMLNKFKTVVLINGGSASSSEIVAGALKDHNLAVLIGEKTFGKGSVQQLENLRDGSALKITIARWLTPNGTEIDKEGIAPDIAIERTVEDYNNFLDPQLDRAVEFLINNE